MVGDTLSPGEPARRPVVVFLCVHNAGRSQMAAAWMQHLAGGRVDVLSAGTEPADRVNPVALIAMAEKGIDLGERVPARSTDDMIRRADVVVTMGCGDTCPSFPGPRYLDWPLPDPAGQPLEAVRPIRDEIELRVRRLLEDLAIEPTG
jgi:protein-tyrosine-phosphatase